MPSFEEQLERIEELVDARAEQNRLTKCEVNHHVERLKTIFRREGDQAVQAYGTLGERNGGGNGKPAVYPGAGSRNGKCSSSAEPGHGRSRRGSEGDEDSPEQSAQPLPDGLDGRPAEPGAQGYLGLVVDSDTAEPDRDGCPCSDPCLPDDTPDSRWARPPLNSEQTPWSLTKIVVVMLLFCILVMGMGHAIASMLR